MLYGRFYHSRNQISLTDNLFDFVFHFYFFLPLFFVYLSKDSQHKFEFVVTATEGYFIDSLIYFVSIFLDLEPDFDYFIFVYSIRIYYSWANP
jgi:hypothetical protein